MMKTETEIRERIKELEGKINAMRIKRDGRTIPRWSVSEWSDYYTLKNHIDALNWVLNETK